MMTPIPIVSSRILRTAVVATFFLLLILGTVAPWLVDEAHAQAACPGTCKSSACDATTETDMGQTEGCSGFDSVAGKDRTCCIAKTATGSSGDTALGQQPRKLIPKGIGDISLQTLAGRFANVLIGISGSVALLVFIYGGFLMLTSAGDDSKVSAGKDAIKWATIGLVVIFGAYAILSALFGAIGAGT